MTFVTPKDGTKDGERPHIAVLDTDKPAESALATKQQLNLERPIPSGPVPPYPPSKIRAADPAARPRQGADTSRHPSHK